MEKTLLPPDETHWVPGSRQDLSWLMARSEHASQTEDSLGALTNQLSLVEDSP